jgi:SAM-dependent methyltransferase
MKLKDYTTANKEAWDQVMPYHQKVTKEDLDSKFAVPGFTIQTNEKLLDMYKSISIEGKDVAHLCCNNGIELLSVKNMGANKCFGFDISKAAITEAQERAKKNNIGCEFVCTDVFDISEEYYNSFDLIQITSGCIGWIPNLELFFEIANKLLRKDGFFLIHEIHPFSEILPFDGEDVDFRLKINEPYFRKEPIVENDSLDYLGNAEYDAKTQYWFVHTISTLINSLSKNNFKIENFIESTIDISCGHEKIEEMNAEVPLSMIILAKK